MERNRKTKAKADSRAHPALQRVGILKFKEKSNQNTLIEKKQRPHFLSGIFPITEVKERADI